MYKERKRSNDSPLNITKRMKVCVEVLSDQSAKGIDERNEINRLEQYTQTNDCSERVRRTSAIPPSIHIWTKRYLGMTHF